MRISHLKHLRAPRSNNELSLIAHEAEGDDVETGELTDGVDVWRVVRGVPRFVPESNYASTFGFQWNRFPGTQLDSVSGLSVSRDRFLAQWGLAPEWFRGRRVLDAGCGAGRFAEVALSLGAEVVAVDLSFAVDACWRTLRSRKNLSVVQASIYDLPFAEGAFDAVFSFGVIQHTPDVARAFRCIAAMAKPGGEVAIDVYRSGLRYWLHPKPWLRPVTKQLPPETLFRAIETAAPALLAVSGMLGRVPRLGRVLRRAVPIADYAGVLPLDARQRHEWAVLDTFDWLSPSFDNPQSAETLLHWAESAGLVDIRTHKPAHLTLRARRPL